MPAENTSRPDLSMIQMVSSALAAVTAAVVGSRLGIAGTIVGAAAGSVIGTAGTAMYGYWLDRTTARVRTVVRLPVPARRAEDPEATAVMEVEDPSDALPPVTTTLPNVGTPRSPRWRAVGLAAAATFAVSIGSITAFEALVGEPVSTLTGGSAGTGTTISRAVASEPVGQQLPGGTVPSAPAPAPDPTATTTPEPTETPEPTPTTTTPTPTPSPTPTETETPLPPGLPRG